MTTVKDIIHFVQSLAPEKMAEDWDPIGLSFGSYNQEVKRILVALDLDEDTLDEAVEKNVDLIVTHHPVIFKPLTNLNEEDPKQRLLMKVIRHNIAIYSAHTNLDKTWGGMNDWLAEALNLHEIEILDDHFKENYYKLVVYVPTTDTSNLVEQLSAAGISTSSKYKDVYFKAQGYGHFTPLHGANPSIGENGRPEKVAEHRVEMIVQEDEINKVVTILQASHPYEEPVYDLYPLRKDQASYGLGRIGNLSEKIRLEDFAQEVKDIFNLDGLRIIAKDLKAEVKRVAIVGGAGSEFYVQAHKKGADVFITGDISYHEAQSIQRSGLSALDPGHFIENIMAKKLADYLSEQVSQHNLHVDILSAKTQTDMFHFM